MPAEVFALANAFLFALHNMLTKKGLKYSNPPTAVLTGLVVNVVVLWGVSLLFLPIRLLRFSGVLLFVLVGFFQPGLTRFLTYKSIETVGVAITDPLRATTPMFSTFLAIVLLGERMTLAIFFSTFLILAGIILLSLRDKSTATKIEARYIFYPLLASLIAGASQILRKYGLESMPHPVLAAAVTATSSLVLVSTIMWFSGRRQIILELDRRSLPFFLAAGMAISLGMVAIYYALDLGRVVVVVPLSSTGPLFTLLLTAIFLKGVERVTLKIVLGAVLIISGAVLLTLWK